MRKSPLLHEIVDNLEVVVQLGVVDGRVAELTFLVDRRAAIDQVLHNKKVIVHCREVQGSHSEEIFCVLKMI